MVTTSKTVRSASKWPKFPVNSLLLMAASRDRIAPNCTIRHPVWPIVALQRRLRFSARLAGFYRIRCHQRRARRAARASFSVFVSNLDFRVPRLRPIGERALTGPCGGEREAARKAQNRDLGYRSVAGASTFWSRCGPGLDPGLRPAAWHPVAGQCFSCACEEPESPTSPPTRP